MNICAQCTDWMACIFCLAYTLPLPHVSTKCDREHIQNKVYTLRESVSHRHFFFRLFFCSYLRIIIAIICECIVPSTKSISIQTLFCVALGIHNSLLFKTAHFAVLLVVAIAGVVRFLLHSRFCAVSNLRVCKNEMFYRIEWCYGVKRTRCVFKALQLVMFVFCVWFFPIKLYAAPSTLWDSIYSFFFFG